MVLVLKRLVFTKDLWIKSTKTISLKVHKRKEITNVDATILFMLSSHAYNIL